jgi:DNA-binding transcriptional MerR regulator
VTVGDLTTDALVSTSGVSLRTIRFYQSEGLLPSPVRHGREARYSNDHVERLRFIGAMRERGLSLAAIREMLAADATDETAIAGWLGLRDVLHRPWTDDRAAVFGEAELADRVDGDPTVVDRLVAAGLVERRDDVRPPVYFVPSVGLLDLTLATLRAGVDLDAGGRLLALVRERIEALASELVTRFTEEVSASHLIEGGPVALTRLLTEVQPLTRQLVDLVFAQEMEKAQRALVAAAEAETLEKGT